MDLKQIKEMIALMDKANLKKIRVKQGDKFEIELEKQDDNPSQPHVAVQHHQDFQQRIHPPQRPLHHDEAPKPEVKRVDGKFITAPLVGTIYHAPSPEDSAFVKVGDRVDENTVVCIIEAMKVMNEIKAEVRGVITEILIDNAKPVEFGQPMFRIRPL